MHKRAAILSSLRTRLAALFGSDLAMRTSRTASKRDELGLPAAAVDKMAPALEREQATTREEKQAREAADALLDTLFDTAPIGLAFLDADLRYVRVNERLAEMNGRPAVAHIGRTVREIVPELAPQLEPLLRQVLASHAPIVGVELESRSPSRSEMKRYRLRSFYPVTDRAGRSLGVGAIVQDITARKQAVEAVRQSELRYRALVELSADWYWEQDENYRFTFRQGHILEQMGLPVEQDYGKARWEMGFLNMTEADWTAHRASLERREEFRDLLLQRESPDGRVHWATISGRPFYDEHGRFKGYHGIGRDVTGQVSAERSLRALNEQLEQRVAERTAALAAANRELEAFSYSVSHDLRAPLRAVNGFAVMLADEYGDRLDAQAKHYLSRIRTGSERMGALIDDLLNLARVTRQEMRLRRIDLSELARELGAELRNRYPERKVELLVAPRAEALADRGLMRVALANLLDNAWKYTSMRPSARVEFGVRRNDAMIECFVQDDGVGFDMCYADKLFGAFQRLHSGSEFPGTGVGLATVARIVQRHGGRVWARSEPGKGATFYFTLAT